MHVNSKITYVKPFRSLPVTITLLGVFNQFSCPRLSVSYSRHFHTFRGVFLNNGRSSNAGDFRQKLSNTVKEGERYTTARDPPPPTGLRDQRDYTQYGRYDRNCENKSKTF